MEQKKSLGIEKLIMYLMVPVIIVIPIVFYFYFFKSSSISTDPEDWSFFGGFLAGAYTLIVGILNLFYLIYLSKKVQEIDHDRNERNIIIEENRNLRNKIDAVVPFGTIELNSTKKGFYLLLKNSGIGPLVIESFEIKYQDEIYNNFAKIFKKEVIINKIKFRTSEFVFGDTKYSISHGKSLVLLKVKFESIEDEKAQNDLSLLITFVKNLNLKIIYNNIHSTDRKELTQKGNYEP